MIGLLITNIFREIRKTFSRFIAIALIAALGVGFFGGLRTTEDSMLETAGDYLKKQKMYDFKLQSVKGISEEELESARKIKSIGKAEGCYELDAFIETKKDKEEKETVAHIASLLDDINAPKIIHGRMPENDEECIADNRAYSKKDIGEKIKISGDNDVVTKSAFKGKEFTIVGIATSPVYLDFERGSTTLGLGKVDSFIYLRKGAFNLPEYSAIYMRMKNWKPAYTDEYDDALKRAERELKAWKPEDAYLTDRKDNNGYITFRENADILNGVAKVFPAFFLLVAVLVCMTTMTRMIDDHRVQIGSIRAMGYSSWAILAQYMFYSVSATLFGSAAGYLTGTKIFQKTIWNAYKTMYDFSNTSKYVADVSFGVTCVTVAVLCAVIATGVSCVNELKEAPAALIRPRAPKSGQRILLERIKPIWNRLGFLHKVPIRNVFRYKKRLIMMIIGIGGCTALLTSGFGIKTTIKDAINFQYENIAKYDYSIFFLTDMNEDYQGLFEREVKDRDSTFEDTDRKYAYRCSGSLTKTTKKHKVDVTISDGKGLDKFIDLHDEKGRIAYPGKGEIAICRKLSDRFDIKVGDALKLKANGEEMRVKVSGIFENYISTPVFINKSTYEEESGKELELNAAYVKVPKRLGEDRMRKQVATATESELSSGAVINKDLVKKFDKMMGSLNAVVLLVILSAGLLAFIVLYNLTNINIIERIREIATIKVLGFRHREVSAYMYRENFILTAIGIAIGLPLGKLLLGFIIKQINVDIIFFVAKLLPSDYIFAGLITVLFTIVVSIVMYRKLIGVDMVESLKSAE